MPAPDGTIFMYISEKIHKSRYYLYNIVGGPNMGFFSKSPEEKQKQLDKEAKVNSIVLTTLDLKRDYEIIDIVISEEIHTDQKFDYDAAKLSLRKRAAAVGADAVIGVQCFLCNTDGHLTDSGNRRWYGTAVKFK